MSNAAPVIDIQGLHKRYGAVHALNGLDLTVGEGEIFGYLGPNGAGKSTTINIVLGFIKATSGAVRPLGSTRSPTEQRCAGASGFCRSRPGCTRT